MKACVLLLLTAIVLVLTACRNDEDHTFSGRHGEVRLITLDPGHFHAALVQKVMYQEIDPSVRIYAPPGQDALDYIARIEQYNQRQDDPTSWKMHLYTGDDFLTRMRSEKAGNVVVISGNNRQKTVYIKACVDAGLHVLADKPMCIDYEGFLQLEKIIGEAESRGILLVDIMTERYEITSILQKMLIAEKGIFGTLTQGTEQKPAVEKVSVHHFYKMVSGIPVKRPAWYFDTKQQGEGIVDVTTHLVDLVQWSCFPGVAVDIKNDIQVIRARRWPTMITGDEFERVTRIPAFPDFLDQNIENDTLQVFANGEIHYLLNGHMVRISVMWNFEAPPGGKDTHRSIVRGSKSDIVIRQGEKQDFRPELTIENIRPEVEANVELALKNKIEALAVKYPGLRVVKTETGYHVQIPDAFRIGHEAHFGQVVRRFLSSLLEGLVPPYETQNLIAKYYITSKALSLAQQGQE